MTELAPESERTGLRTKSGSFSGVSDGFRTRGLQDHNLAL